MRKYFKRLSAVVMTAMLTVTSFTVMPQKMFAASVAFTNVGEIGRASCRERVYTPV